MSSDRLNLEQLLLLHPSQHAQFSGPSLTEKEFLREQRDAVLEIDPRIYRASTISDIEMNDHLDGHDGSNDGAEFLAHAADDGFDGFLGGALRCGEITEIVGQSASGKTQFCLSAAIETAARSPPFAARLPSAKARDFWAMGASSASSSERPRSGLPHTGTDPPVVVYLDTGHQCSPTRLKQIYSSRYGTEKSRGRVKSIVPTLQSIRCFPVFDIDDAFRTLETIRNALQEKETELHRSLKLIVVDSFAALMSTVLGIHNYEGHAWMTRLSRTLKGIAVDHKVAVLVTNHMVADRRGSPDRFQSATKPALGETWTHIPSTRMLLRQHALTSSTGALKKSTDDEDEDEDDKGGGHSRNRSAELAAISTCTAEILASSVRAPGACMDYTIGAAGIQVKLSGPTVGQQAFDGAEPPGSADSYC